MANVQTVKRADRRFDIIQMTHLGIQGYGKDNLYPTYIQRIVSASESASVCLDRYKSFIQGNGFKSIQFSETKLNFLNETADDILQLLVSDVANFRGLAIHLNYNIFGQVVEIFHVPFENCRLIEPDSDGYVGKIAVHPDWTGHTMRAGRYVQVIKSNIDYVDIFNPDPEIIRKQIEESGGIENYKGQILWISEAGKFIYPKPVHDAVVAQMSTEEGLGNISNRNARSNFLPFGTLTFRRGQNIKNRSTDSDKENPSNFDSIESELLKLQGDEDSLKILVQEVEFDDEIPKFDKWQGQNYDKDFTVTTETSSGKIYSAFNQEIWHRMLSGSMGFTTQMITDAFDYYSAVTNKERRMIERAFDKIFKIFHQEVNPGRDFTIQPLKYIASGTTPNNAG